MSKLFNEPVLFVDDDVNLIEGMRRLFHKSFNLHTALGGQEALALIETSPPFAVIISDMSMPEMNGIEFLSEAQKRSPDSVRMMLTGNADLETAMEAVNESNIFRFLVKPAGKPALSQAIAAGIRQYRLVTAERELLEKTLSSSVKVLTDVLGLVNPAAFSRAARVRDYCQQLAEALSLENRWEYSLAALLSQVGCVSVPMDTLAKIDAGDELDGEEAEMYESHPALGRELLEKIPRLDRVACWVGNQHLDFQDYDAGSIEGEKLDDEFGGMMLKAAIDLDTKLSGGVSKEKAVARMRQETERYHPRIIEQLHTLKPVEVAVETRLLPIAQLNSTMMLAEDILTHEGLLLAKQGQEISPSMKARLENYSRRGEIDVQVRISIMRGAPREACDEPIPVAG